MREYKSDSEALNGRLDRAEGEFLYCMATTFARFET